MLMDIQHTKLHLMPTKSKEELADYVRRIRQEKGLSVQEVENAARRAGFKISRSYVSQIENRYILSVTAAKLQALARGLGVSEDEVFDVARGKSEPEGNSSKDKDPTRKTLERLPLKFDRTIPGLPADKRINVAALIDLLDKELDRLSRERDK